MAQPTCLVHRFILVALAAAAFTPRPIAATFNVGPTGSYATIQDALDETIASGFAEEIRIATSGSPYVENIFVVATSTWTGSLTISGGWNDTFDVQTADPTLTVIDGDASDRIFHLIQDAGTIEMSNLTLDGGRATSGQGSGLLADIDSAILTLSDLVISNSIIAASGVGATGGGISITATGTASATLEDSVVFGNATQTDAGSNGGGGAFSVSDTADLTVRRTLFEANAADTTADASSSGCGIYVTLFGAATAQFEDITLRGNRCTGTGNAAGAAATLISGSGSTVVGKPTLTVRRLVADGNLNEKTDTNTAYQVDAFANDGDVIFTDSLVVRGNQRGVRSDAFTAAAVTRLTNVTVADHPDLGLRFEGNSAANSSLYNSIAFGNSTDDSIVGTLSEGNNLFGSDPGFFAPDSGEYSLRQGSAAVDAGSGAPPGGLGAGDVEGDTRVQGLGVDVGAYEGPCERCIFADGFESGNTSIWSP